MDSSDSLSSTMGHRYDPLKIFPATFNTTEILSRVTTEQGFSFYGTFDKDQLVASTASIIAACTDANVSLMSKLLSDFLIRTRDDCLKEASDPETATQACWFHIKMVSPTDVFSIPRWHRDGRMFDCFCSNSNLKLGPRVPHSKYAVTLLGPATLVLAPGQQQVVETFSECEWWRDEERVTLAERLAECERVEVKTGQIMRFTWGEDDSPVHSEPDWSQSDRVFMSVMYASKKELKVMCDWREMEYVESSSELMRR